MKRIVSFLLSLAMTLSVISIVPGITVSAKESVGNGLILSTDMISLTEGSSANVTAVLTDGTDASGLQCVVADPNIATITPIAYASNAAAFQISYCNSGSTVAAIYYINNPAVVAYLTVSANCITMDIPEKLGTNHNNYCKLVSYEFVPYDFTYADFNDYKYTLNIKYQCTSYEDDEFNKWGCYGYFYDESGNVISKVHLYCSALSKGRTYHSEFNVPVNAVKFSVEGF